MEKLKLSAVYLLLLLLSVGVTACSDGEDDEPKASLPNNFLQTLMNHVWESEIFEDIYEWGDGNISINSERDYNFFFENGYGIRLTYWRDEDSYFGTTRGYEPKEFHYSINGDVLMINDLKYTYSNGKLISSNGGLTLTQKTISEGLQEEVDKARASFMSVSERLENIKYTHEWIYEGSNFNKSKSRVNHFIDVKMSFDAYTLKQMCFYPEIHRKIGYKNGSGSFIKDKVEYVGCYKWSEDQVSQYAFMKIDDYCISYCIPMPPNESVIYCEEYYLVDEFTGDMEFWFSKERTLEPSQFKEL